MPQVVWLFDRTIDLWWFPRYDGDCFLSANWLVPDWVEGEWLLRSLFIIDLLCSAFGCLPFFFGDVFQVMNSDKEISKLGTFGSGLIQFMEEINRGMYDHWCEKESSSEDKERSIFSYKQSRSCLQLWYIITSDQPAYGMSSWREQTSLDWLNLKYLFVYPYINVRAAQDDTRYPYVVPEATSSKLREALRAEKKPISMGISVGVGIYFTTQRIVNGQERLIISYSVSYVTLYNIYPGESSEWWPQS